MPRDFCVHGHFYQPPREDPFSGIIAAEPGAEPFNNWNEKIYARCYQPNAEMGNFRKISFNIGPTLFTWLEQNHPCTYHQILDQEREIFQRYAASNAMAQACYHPILPLASRRDKTTCILWGIHDYQHRYGHSPDGMWLPECAVDIETLEVLAQEGILFTILAPWQAATHQLDVTQPYRVELPDDNDIIVFFYEGYLSGAISFDPPATINADDFVQNRLLPTYPDNSNDNPLIIVASDGELYGHHQPFREQFLSHLLDGAAEAHGLIPTFPGVWLQDHEPEQSMAIYPNTSWSCHHGIERWRTTCPDGPTSTWKAPLRQALDHLANEIDRSFEEALQPLCSDPWELRNEWMGVKLGELTANEFFSSFAHAGINTGQRSMAEKMLTAEDHRFKMFASDAWFFEEFDRIEPCNAIRFGAYAAWLIKQAVGVDFYQDACADLASVQSTISNLTGEKVFQTYWKWLEAQPGPA